MESRTLVFQALELTPPLDRFVHATIEAMSLLDGDVQWTDLGADCPNDHFYRHSWQRVQTPWVIVELFADSSVPATWIEVQGEDAGDVLRIEGVLRSGLPVELPQDLLDRLRADSANPPLLTRTALAHVGREAPNALRKFIEEALRSPHLDLFAAACTSAALLPSSSYEPILEERGRTDAGVARLVESTLAHLKLSGHSG